MASKDPLEREYGVLLAVSGPILMEKAQRYREMADLIQSRLGERKSAAVIFLRAQADRAEESIISLASRYDSGP